MEINGTPTEDLIVIILKDFLDQIQEPKKRKSQLQALDGEKLALANMEDEIIDDGGITIVTLSVSEWLLFKKRILLRKKEKCEALSRKQETRGKMLIQDTLRVSSKQKIQPLENRRLFLPWQTDYTKLKTQFHEMNMQNW